MAKLSLSNLSNRTLHILKKQVLPLLSGLVLFGGLYAASITIPQGWVTWAAVMPACLVTVITALARANDIKPEQSAWHWQVRKTSLVLVGTAATAIACMPVLGSGHFPSWITVAMVNGLAGTWLTTPGLPPWWKYITGEFRNKRVEVDSD